MMEVRPPTKINVEVKRLGRDGHLAFDFEETNRFGRTVSRHTRKRNPSLLWRVDFRREDGDGLPQFGLTGVTLVKRCKGLYRAELPMDHLLTWPDVVADVYANRDAFRRELGHRRDCAVGAGETILKTPPKAALKKMIEQGVLDGSALETGVLTD